MTRSERMLLLALFRWARAEGGLSYGYSYTWARGGTALQGRWGIDFFPGDFEKGGPVRLEIWRDRISMKDYWVASIAEAVDLVVALGIAPARFSTAYRAGYNAAMQAHQIARSAPSKLASPRGWQCPEVYALLPWADTELVRQP